MKINKIEYNKIECKEPFISNKNPKVLILGTIPSDASIGESNFYSALEYLIVDAKIIKDVYISNMSNLELLLGILDEQLSKDNKIYDNIIQIFNLLFPNFEVVLSKKELALVSANDQKELKLIFNNNNFIIFQNIIKEMFCLNNNKNSNEQKYNPSGQRAQEIANKFKKRHEILNDNKDDKTEQISILTRYVSILSVGLKKNMLDLLKYTLFQLIDEFERFNLYTTFDLNIRVRLAGASDVEEAENWTKDLY